MRRVYYFLVLVALWTLIPSAPAAHDLEGGRNEGELMDERVLLFDDLIKAAKFPGPYPSETERALQVPLVAFASRLRSNPERISRFTRDEISALQRLLALKKRETGSRLASAQSHRQRHLTVAERHRDMAIGLVKPLNVDWTKLPPIYRDLHEQGKKFLAYAQSEERAARDMARVEAMLAKELNMLERVSYLLGKRAKEIPSVPTKAPPAKNQAR